MVAEPMSLNGPLFSAGAPQLRDEHYVYHISMYCRWVHNNTPPLSSPIIGETCSFCIICIIAFHKSCLSCDFEYKKSVYNNVLHGRFLFLTVWQKHHFLKNIQGACIRESNHLIHKYFFDHNFRMYIQ